jgi:hypothetical protein
MIGFLVQDVHVNKMVKMKIKYIPLNVGQVGHFRTPMIYGILSDHGGTLDGSRHFVHIFIVVYNVGYMGVHDPIKHSKSTFKLMVVTERNSAMGKSVNGMHLCKNLRLGL